MHFFRLCCALLTGGSLLVGCASVDLGGPVAPEDDPAAGTLTLPTGRAYSVYPEELAYTGEAAYRWPDGRTYVGDFSKGNRTGHGTMTYPDGRTVTGEFKDGEYVNK